MKKIFCCPDLELFHCLPPLFGCLPLWTTVRVHGKKVQNATKVKTSGRFFLNFVAFSHCLSFREKLLLILGLIGKTSYLFCFLIAERKE